MFDPRDIGILKVWLDAQDYSTLEFSSGSAVSKWKDKSGYSNDANTQIGSGAVNTYGASLLNSKPAIKVGDSNGFSEFRITDAASLDYSAMHAFVVARIESGTGGETIIGKSITEGQREFTLTTSLSTNNLTGVSYPSGTSASGIYITQSSYLATSTNYIFEISNNGGTHRIGANGRVLQTATAAVFNGTDYITIGQNTTNNVTTFGEVLLFTKALSIKERKILLTYLSQKWGLPVKV